jgi:hypothetical protein
VVAGNTIYIQSGTYVKVGTNAYVLTLSVSGGNGTAISWIGYITNHSTIPTGTDRPLFNGNSDTANCLVGGTTIENIFKNIRFANATATGCSNSSLGSWFFVNCKSSNNATDGFGGDDAHLFNCEVNNNSDAGYDSTTVSGCRITGSYIHDNTTEGWFSANTGSSLTVIKSISESNGGEGFRSSGGSLVLMDSLAYNNTGATIDGINWSEAGHGLLNTPMINNCSINNGRYGFNRGSTTAYTPIDFDYNNYNGNGTAGLNNLTAGANDTTAAPAFTGAATGDFTVTSSDTALLGKGFMQSAINGLTGDYQWNIGVDQDDNVTAGGVATTSYGFVQ